MKFIIVDWMNNVCFDSQDENFQTIEDADEFLDRRIEEHLEHDGLKAYQEHGDISDDFEEYRGEYSIEEYREGIDRLLWNGQRYVLKQDYCRVIA